MNKYVKPEIKLENVIVDEQIAALEVTSSVDLDTGASDKETFENLFGNLG